MALLRHDGDFTNINLLRIQKRVFLDLASPVCLLVIRQNSQGNIKVVNHSLIHNFCLETSLKQLVWFHEQSKNENSIPSSSVQTLPACQRYGIPSKFITL